MLKLRIILSLVTFGLIISCQTDSLPEIEPSVIFSVDLDNHKFNTDYKKAYIAAYTPEGVLINYGSLSDSSKWDLKGQYLGDKVDIVYFEIWQGSSLIVDHFKNINKGHLFTNLNPSTPSPADPPGKSIMLKVEDFGNRDGNSTASEFQYETRPHKHIRGYAHPYGEFTWEKVENGYTYKKTNIESNSKNQGTEIILFERGTNKPYVKYLDFPASAVTNGDTITLQKSDFQLGELNTIQVNSQNNEYYNIFLYTNHSHDGRKDLITSFEDVPSTATEKKIKYVSSNLLPMTYWDFRYNAKNNNNTSYNIRTNNTTLPSTIDIKELTGHTMIKNGNQFSFTHSAIFPGKQLARSALRFSKSENYAQFTYWIHFDGNESIGTKQIVPFKIPTEVLANYTDFIALDNIDWNHYLYSQTYTNIPGNSVLGYFQSTILNWIDINSSNNSYVYEVFTIKLQ